MNIKISPLPLWFALCLILGGSLFLLGWLAPITHAGSDLPNRATPTPVSGGSASDDDDGGGEPVGAYIILSASAGSWTVVEWQDSDDRWHLVDGWQGNLTNGSRQWWVAPKDFGTGPFRWVVQQGPAGEVVGMSEPFYLPQGANEVLSVTVTTK